MGLHPFRRIRNPGVGGEKVKLKISVKDLALMSIFAALYAALVYAFAGLSFLPSQFRIAGALRPGIAKKWILAFGYGLGAVVGNIFSPFTGPWDMIFMPAMSVIAGIAGYLIAKPFGSNYFLAGAVIATIVPVSLSFMFSQFGSPILATLPLLIVGEQTVCLLGAVVFKAVDARFKWWN